MTTVTLLLFGFVAIVALIAGFLDRHLQRPDLTADAASSRDDEPEDFATMGAR
jgi:hypothetical protein